MRLSLYCQITTETGSLLTVSIDGFVDIETATRLLGISARRVNQLADAGDIIKGSRGLYDRLSIERYLVSRRGTAERAWDTSTAWAAVALLSGPHLRPGWFSERSTYRLEATLRTITASELVGKARGRASVQVFAGHPSAARIIRGTVVARDWTIVGLAGETGDNVDGYVGSDDLANVVQRYALTPSSSGNITLRVTDFDMKTVRALAKASDVLVSLDAAGSVDARTRGVGERVLERALSRFRELR